jgi:hypothetical protein
MLGLSNSIRNICRGLAGSLREYPLEALLGITYFLLFAIWNKTDILVWFFPHYVLLYTLHKFSRKSDLMKILYVLSWFLWIPLLLWATRYSGWNAGIAYLLALILLVIGEKPLDNESYGRNILNVAIKVAMGFLIGALLMGIVTAIIGSVNLLFDLNLKDEWFTYPNAFIALVAIPLLCCWSVSRPLVETKDNKLLQIAVDYILSPALIIYSVILYAYIARILFRWELPVGGVAYMVLTFSAIALLCYLFRLQIEKRHFEWFYKAFPAIAIPPLVLLWIGTLRRIGEYGITEPRFYLLLLAILVTIFVAMLPRKKTRKFQLMTLILAVAAILSTYVPGIRAKDFEIRSQRNRPVEEISGLEDNTDKVIEPQISSVNDIGGPVYLEGCTLFIPRSEYYYYEDSVKAVFYKDETRTEPLLECNILEMLEADVKDPASKLIYKNDRYMAVFNMIEDRRGSGNANFLTSGAMLFCKPEQ